MRRRVWWLITLALTFILWACDHNPEASDDIIAGGTTTDPSDFPLSIAVKFADSSLESRAYVFDVENPVEAIDSAEVDSNDRYVFEVDSTYPPALRILVRNSEQGFLSDTISVERVRDSLLADSTSYELEEFTGGLELEGQAEDYSLDTLRLDISDQPVGEVQVYFENESAVEVQPGVFIIERLESQTEILVIKEAVDEGSEPSEEVILEINEVGEFEVSSREVEIQDFRPNLIFELMFDNIDSDESSFEYGSGSMLMSGKLFELAEDQQARANTAMMMDSVDALIELQEHQIQTDKFVVELWFSPVCVSQCGLFGTKMEDPDNPGDTIDGERIGLIYNGFAQASVMSEQGMDVMSGTTEVMANDWYHMVFQYEHGSKAQLYLNGVLEAESLFEVPVTTQPVTAIIPGSALEIAANLTNPYYEGRMSEMRLWDKLFSPTEVLARYNLGK